MIRTMPRAAPGLRVPAALFLGLALGACSLQVTTGEDSGNGIVRCGDCVGEDGGAPAPGGIDGRTVATIETESPNPALGEFLLRATIPVPRRTYPRIDGREPLVILDWNGMPLTTQIETVSRYPVDADGADVVELLAKVHIDPAAVAGSRLRYAVVQSPHPAVLPPGTVGLEDLLTTSNVPVNTQDMLADPNSIEITAYDCFGNKYVCRPLDGTGDLRLERRGPVTTEMRIFQTMLPEPYLNGASGTLPRFFGVHTYLSTLSGHEGLGLVLRFTNGGSGRDLTTTVDDPLDKLYFQKIQLTVPADLVLVQDFPDPFLGGSVVVGDKRVWDLVKPLADGKLHVVRWLGQFHRRLWLGGGVSGFANAYADGIGQGFCVRGADAIFGVPYWSWWNKGTARYFPQKFVLPALEHVGLGSIRSQLYGEMDHLRTRLLNGTSDGNYPIASAVLGWGHPYGVSYGGMTSGNEIFCWDGVSTAASASIHGMQMFRALHRMHTERQPNALYDGDGEPSTVERWLRENGALDYVPFYFFVVPQLGGNFPDPFGFAAAPRFQSDYVAANGLKPGYEDAHLGFDPHDYQHLIRYTRSAKALAWLGNDSLAKDDLRMQAEMFHLAYHPYRNDVNGGSSTSGLRAQQMVVAAHPHKGGPFGRGEAWGLDAAAATYCLATPAWRAAKRPWFAAISELLLNQQATCSGFLQAFVSNKAVNGRYRARQQIEQSITENALQGLRESVFRGANPGHADMVRDVLTDSLYGFISNLAWQTGHGPWRYTGMGPLDVNQPVWCSHSQMPGDAVTAGDWETFQDWSSFAYGYELTGDPLFFERALEQLGGATDLYQRLRNDGLNNLENRSALLGQLQDLNGVL